MPTGLFKFLPSNLQCCQAIALHQPALSSLSRSTLPDACSILFFLQTSNSHSLSHSQLMTLPPISLRNRSSKQPTCFWTIYSIFSPVIVDKLSMLLSKANLSTCALDSIPFCLFKDMALSPTLIFLYIINFSFSQFSHLQANMLIFVSFYKILLTPLLSATALFPSFFQQNLKKMSPKFSSHSLFTISIIFSDMLKTSHSLLNPLWLCFCPCHSTEISRNH